MGMSPRLLRPRASGGFNPKNIAGLQLWLDAADSSTITTGTGVSQWRDKSATGSVWGQTTANNQPATGTQTLNGKNVLVFDGSNDSLSAVTPLNTTMPLSLFFTTRLVSATDYGMTYATSANDNINIRLQGNSGVLEIVAGGGTVYSAGTSRVGTNEILSWIVPAGAGTNSRLFRNGVELALSGPTLKPDLTGTHYIGQRADGFHANIWVAEMVAYSTELTNEQRAKVEAYLSKKWGISVA